MSSPSSASPPAPRLDLERRAGFGERLRRLGRWMLWAFPLALVLTIARSTLADQYHVPTSSMWPTIEPGDRIFVSKAAYGLRVPFTDFIVAGGGEPEVGQVVIFVDPRGGPIPLVKRVVALGGQTVALTHGVLHVDGIPQRLERLDDGRVVEHLGVHIHEAGRQDFEDFAPHVVPTGHMFVMGDNRAVSMDSRIIGAIPLRLLRGRVVGTVYRFEDDALDASRILHGIE